jgi:hypothetical protein
MPRIWAANLRKKHALKEQTIVIKRGQPNDKVRDIICDGQQRRADEDKHYD